MGFKDLEKYTKHLVYNKLKELMPEYDMACWHINSQTPDNIFQCERYTCNCVYFNFLPNGQYEIEIYLPKCGEILSYKFDEASIAVLFYQSHCDHLTGIRKYLKESIYGF